MNPHTSPPFPSDEEGELLYKALLQPTATATWDFARAYLPPLADWLRSRNRHVSPDLCDEAAGETVRDLLMAPEHFDPRRGTKLLAFLRLAAQRDLLNVLEREARHAHQPLEEKVVELHGPGRNYQRGEGPLTVLCDQEDEAQRQAFLDEIRADLRETDRRVFDLMAAGERATPVFAAAMDITHRPDEEQEIEVKRAKDRIKARMKRGGNPHE